MENQSLDDMWGEAIVRFKQLTNQDLNLSPPRTLDYITRQIESRQIADISTVEKEDSKRRAKDISMNTISCIKLLGGLAAQAGSMVFGSADLCFNAVSILLDIPSKLHEFHEAVDSLLNEVSVLLSQFKIYKRIEKFADIDPELHQTVRQLLVSFVNICALSINLGKDSKWYKRLKNATKKVLFDDDSGIQKELDGFRALIKKQSVIGEIVTLESVLKTGGDIANLLNEASESGRRIVDIQGDVKVVKSGVADIQVGVSVVQNGVDALNKDAKDRKMDTVKAERLKSIQEKFAIPNADDTIQASKTICTKLWTDSFKTTGSWLPTIPAYESWIDAKSDADPLLLITGDASSGKSFLTSTIIHKLQSTYSLETKGTERAPLVAYHFFQSNTTEKSGHNQRLAETALKCLALQLAHQDSSYARDIANFCDSPKPKDFDFKDASCREIWDVLKFVDPKRDRTYFLVLDGLEQLPDDDARNQLFDIINSLRNMMNGSARSRIRLLASGHSKAFEEIVSKAATIEIEKHNSGEIRSYIEQELQRLDLLRSNDEEVVRWRGLIDDKLSQTGNYFKVMTALEKIREVVDADREGASKELDKILEEADQAPDVIAKSTVKALNDELSSKDIDEVNELLPWVMYGALYLSINELKAALYLSSKTVSAVHPLEKKITGKYSKLFKYDNWTVDVKENIADAVTTLESTRKAISDAPKISATITITNADIKTVQSFFWNLTEQAMINNFEFKNSAATVQTKGSIRVNEFDSHLNIVKQSFKLLMAEVSKSTDALAFYALACLPGHLAAIRDHAGWSSMQAADKTDIGKDVYSLLESGDIIKKHWKSLKLHENSYFFGPSEWFSRAKGPSSFWRWLEDPDAIRNLGHRDKDWLTKLRSESNANQSLLRDVTEMVAEKWLRDREWDVWSTFQWIHSFLSMKQPEPAKTLDEAKEVEAVGDKDADQRTNKEENQIETKDEDKRSNDDYNDDKPTNISTNSEDVVVAAMWVKAALKIDDLDTLWHERLGRTYSQVCHDENSAIESFKTAISMDNPSWMCFQGLGLAYDAQGDLSSAIPQIERSIAILESIENPTKEEHESLLKNIALLADWKGELEDTDTAIKLYEEILIQDPKNSDVQFKLLNLMLSNDRNDEAIRLLEAMSNSIVENEEYSQLAAIFEILIDEYDSDALFSMIFMVIQTTSFFGTVMEHLEEAINVARMRGKFWQLASMLIQKGIALYHYDKRPEKSLEMALAAWEESGAVVSRYQEWRIVPLNVRAGRLISSHHFQEAISSPTPDIQIEKLEQLSTRRYGSGVPDSYARSYLGCYYSLHMKDLAKAKEIFLGDMKSALAFLTDDIDDNDYQGYRNLAEILAHSGDDLNALSAWSLLGPIEITVEDKSEAGLEALKESLIAGNDTTESIDPSREAGIDKNIESNNELEVNVEAHISPDIISKVEVESKIINTKPGDDEANANKLTEEESSEIIRYGQINNNCDGRCGKIWTYADNFYCCKICSDVQLCAECLAKLQDGKLKRFICHPGHEWLHVPKWDDKDFKEVGSGNVRVGGSIEDGKRVGGTIVKVDEWLNMLRDEWEIPRTEAISTKYTAVY